MQRMNITQRDHHLRPGGHAGTGARSQVAPIRALTCDSLEARTDQYL